MVKKRKVAKKTTVKRRSAKKAEVKKLEAQADVDMLRGRYANHIQVTVQEEELVLDFLARAGEQATVISRVFITPQHGKRLQELLRRQLAIHKKNYGPKAKR